MASLLTVDSGRDNANWFSEELDEEATKRAEGSALDFKQQAVVRTARALMGQMKQEPVDVDRYFITGGGAIVRHIGFNIIETFATRPRNLGRLGSEGDPSDKLHFIRMKERRQGHYERRSPFLPLGLGGVALKDVPYRSHSVLLIEEATLDVAAVGPEGIRWADLDAADDESLGAFVIATEPLSQHANPYLLKAFEAFGGKLAVLADSLELDLPHAESL